jgi:Predicted transcriptional regulator with C-terminal CBS domains
MQDGTYKSICQCPFENKKGGSMGTPTNDLARRLKDLEYAKLYGSEQIKADLAITLSKARHKLNMTQKQFADVLKSSQPYIAKLEGGAANPTIGAVGAMLSVVGLSLVTHTESLLPSPVDSVSALQQPTSFAPLSNVVSLAEYNAGASGDFTRAELREAREAKTINA